MEKEKQNRKVLVEAPAAVMIVEGSIVGTYEYIHKCPLDKWNNPTCGFEWGCYRRAQFHVVNLPESLAPWIVNKKEKNETI